MSNCSCVGQPFAQGTVDPFLISLIAILCLLMPKSLFCSSSKHTVTLPNKTSVITTIWSVNLISGDWRTFHLEMAGAGLLLCTLSIDLLFEGKFWLQGHPRTQWGLPVLYHITGNAQVLAIPVLPLPGLSHLPTQTTFNQSLGLYTHCIMPTSSMPKQILPSLIFQPKVGGGVIVLHLFPSQQCSCSGCLKPVADCCTTVFVSVLLTALLCHWLNLY